MNILGLSEVVDDMREMDGWDDGCVVIESSYIVRDPITTRIIGLRKRLILMLILLDFGADGMSKNMAAMVRKPLLQM